MANQSKDKYLEIGRQRFNNDEPRPTDADLAKGWQQRAIAQGWDEAALMMIRSEPAVRVVDNGNLAQATVQYVAGQDALDFGTADVIRSEPAVRVVYDGNLAQATVQCVAALTRAQQSSTYNAHTSHGQALAARAAELSKSGNTERAARLYAKAQVFLNHA